MQNLKNIFINNKYKIIKIITIFFIIEMQIVLLGSSCRINNIIAATTTYVWSNMSNKLDTTETSIEPYTNDNTVTDDPLKLESESCCLMEQSTGYIIYEKNMHEQLRPASVTKIMSLLLIMEAIDSGRISLTDNVPCTEDAAAMGGSQIWLDTRETLTVEEMIKAICVVSANDCVVAMADYLEGSQEAFVNKMNEKAKEIGMNDTCFKNCHGIDEEGHLTSSYDIALMSRKLLENHPAIKKYTTIYMDTLRDGKSSLVNTNKLIRNYDGITGLKTGSTSLALYNLSASATRDNLSLISVTMKSPTSKIRFNEATKLLDYGFNNYMYNKIANKGDLYKEIQVEKGISNKIDVVYEENTGFITKKGNNNDIVQDVTLDESIIAPITEGQRLGNIKYSINGDNIGKVNLIAKKEVQKISFKTVLNNILLHWFTLYRY